MPVCVWMKDVHHDVIIMQAQVRMTKIHTLPVGQTKINNDLMDREIDMQLADSQAKEQLYRQIDRT